MTFTPEPTISVSPTPEPIQAPPTTIRAGIVNVSLAGTGYTVYINVDSIPGAGPQVSKRVMVSTPDGVKSEHTTTFTELAAGDYFGAFVVSREQILNGDINWARRNVIIEILLEEGAGSETPTPAPTPTPTPEPTPVPEIQLTINGRLVFGGEDFVSVSGALVKVSPPPDNNGIYSANTVVALVALPRQPGALITWTGVDSQRENTATVKMTEARSVELLVSLAVPTRVPVLAQPTAP